jgi:hypothetical protein
VSQPRFQLVPGSRLGSGKGVGWRLLGSNNRELGRSAGHHDDAEAAITSIERVREVATTGTAHIVHDSSTGLWAWQLSDADGEPVAVAGRGFRYERECRYNLDQFRATAPVAPAAGTIPPQPAWRLAAVEPEVLA